MFKFTLKTSFFNLKLTLVISKTGNWEILPPFPLIYKTHIQQIFNKFLQGFF